MTCGAAGHEGAGVVVALGEGVGEEQWKVGDRAGIKPLFDVCHECMHCRGGDEGLCPKLLPTGAFSDGSFAEVSPRFLPVGYCAAHTDVYVTRSTSSHPLDTRLASPMAFRTNSLRP